MRLRARITAFGRARSASVAVEFALVATILIMLSAVGIDLINISSFNREIERTTTQVAEAIVSCPASSTPGYISCTTDTIQQYTDRKANVLVRLAGFPSMTLAILQVNEISNTIRVCAGTSTALDPDIQTKALSVLSDKDVAIVVVISMNYTPYFPEMMTLLMGSSSTMLRGYTISVQVSNVQLC